MNLLLANSSLSVPIGFWVGGIVALLAGTGLGFFAGYYLGRDATKRAIKRAGKEVSRLVETIFEVLDTAQSACTQLDSLSGLKLSQEQHQTLQSKQTNLFKTLTGIFKKTDEKKPVTTPPETVQQEDAKSQKDVKLEWECLPLNDQTNLPGREAFDISLPRLLEYCTATNKEAGFLFIKVDKFSHLESRFGQAGASKFLQTMGRLIVKAMRDDDLLCQYNRDTFALLMPTVDLDAGKKIVHAIRSAIRHHRFRLDAGSPEVLVTASFGYTQCTTTDAVELSTNRASNGLAHSQRRGRNQLHISIGSDLVHCGAL